MRLVALGVVLAVVGLVNGHAVPQTAPVYAATAVPFSPAEHSGSIAPAALTDVVKRYCVVCHNDQMMTGNLSLGAFDVDKAAEKPETAERMIRKLRAAMMPPPGAPRPSQDTLLALVQTIESNVDAAAKAAPKVGERRFQRLSRVEYERVIHDLLALDVDAGEWLPPDFYSGAFDNQSAAQPFSATLLDSFLRAASEVARVAIGNQKAVSTTVKHVNPDRVSQQAWDRLEGAPFGTRGGMVVMQDFPADGEYILGVLTAQGTGNETAVEDLDFSIDGEPVALLKLEHNGTKVAGPIVTEPVFVRAGQHRVSAAFVNLIDGPYEDRFHPVGWSAAGNASAEYGTTGLTHVTELWITGPRKITGVSETASRQRIFTCRPESAAKERPCAESILTALATQAYRRPVTKEDVAELLVFYDQGAADGQGFETGVRAGLQAILMNPEFLFRIERAPAGVEPGQGQRLTDVELATRLSFFLWDTAPDKDLLDLAARGKLRPLLDQQVRRMLEDPRSEALSTRFAHQWLQLQDVAKVWPQAYLYPDFTQQLANDLVRETEMLFQHLVREDKSLLELFSANYTFLNERLAQHYGIPGVSGEEMRLVQYPTDQRRGVLSHGSLLQLTSVSDRTSPVLRGKFVMSVMMGTPPPPPPPNIPALDASPTSGGGRRLTTRERMAMHSKNPVCSSCHNFIDPIGLALDNFDVTGRWRIRENMAALDTRGSYYDGTPISRPSELVDVLLKRPIPLARTFTANLLSYAIGRPVEYYDGPTIRAITVPAAEKNYSMSSLIMGVVKSDAFQMKQAQTTTSSY
ncbi:MAG: DUF1592 domain-containing protein [Gemmatimonadetes bacterium]|nr:DUF1592 domain-containing protein [Gemmatimonadota bacterium]